MSATRFHVGQRVALKVWEGYVVDRLGVIEADPCGKYVLVLLDGFAESIICPRIALRPVMEGGK